MKKLIAILTASACALAVIAHAAKPPQELKDEVAAKKPKNAPKQQPAAPQQYPAPNTRLPKAPKTEPPADTARTTVPKKPERAVPPVESTKPSSDKSKRLKAEEQKPLETDKQTRQQEKPKQEQQSIATTDQPQQQKKTKPSQESIAKIRAQHRDFKAQPNTSIASVQFNQNYQVANAQNWTGPRYDVYRTYRPQWHDRSWWTSRYTTISLIGGGWYYWDAGYWYPAWGYDTAVAYYPYDGPIYVGSDPRPFDQVVADVQAVLQEMGYYRGEVDGLLGPLTRQALADYQSANGLYTTQTIDEPTLESLGLT